MSTAQMPCSQPQVQLLSDNVTQALLAHNSCDMPLLARSGADVHSCMRHKHSTSAL